MAFLNKQERDQLLTDIKDRNFPQIRGIINRRDKKARLAYYRNVQEVGKWMTRYVLEGLGTQVTIVETPAYHAGKKKTVYTIQEIVVEPTPDNRL